MKYANFYGSIILMSGLFGCASRERIPDVSIAEVPATFKIASQRQHGPKSLLNSIVPDIPSGVTITLERQQSLHNAEPRYFIAASAHIQVVSIEKPEQYDTPYRSFTDTIESWRQLISDDTNSDFARKRLYSGQLAEIPWTNAGRCFHAKLRYHNYSWGKAVSFLTTYVQGRTGGPVNNDMLVLVVQGFTHDGRYAVNAHLQIENSNLPESLWDKNKDKVQFSIDDETDQAEKWLDAQIDSSFSPSFSEYNRLLNSLRINSA